MGRVRRGGYIIEWWMGDHSPKHVHIYRDGKLIAKVQVPGLLVLTGQINKRLFKILQDLMREKKI